MKVPRRRRRHLVEDDRTTAPWKCDDLLLPDLCDNLTVTEGSVEIRGIEVRYWKYEIQSPYDNEYDYDYSNSSYSTSSIGSIPIVAIHGGPGFTHNYMLPLKQQACRGRPIYFYDQAGCGKSSLPEPNISVTEKYPWLLTSEYYSLEELPILIQHWGLQAYHIIGNSWGTILSQIFALDGNDDIKVGLKSMVLSGPLSEAKLYVDSQWSEEDGTIGSLPLYVQGRIRSLEDEKAYNTVEYEEIVEIMTSQFTIRTAPYPDCFLKSRETANEEIYVGMQGASEFTIGGVLETLNITHRLVEIPIPVFLTHGKYDTMRPAVIQAMQDVLPVVESLLLNKSGHISMIDEPKMMNAAIANFFDRVERGDLVGRWDSTTTTTTITTSSAIRDDNSEETYFHRSSCGGGMVISRTLCFGSEETLIVAILLLVVVILVGLILLTVRRDKRWLLARRNRTDYTSVPTGP